MRTIASLVVILILLAFLVATIHGSGIREREAGILVTDDADISSLGGDPTEEDMHVSGRIRKLLIAAPGSTPKVMETQAQERKKKLQGSSTTSQVEATGSFAGEADHELVGLAGMDYSPAERKSPIHN